MMQTVYDAQGVAYNVEPVDAREWIGSGSYFAEPPEATKAAEVLDAVPPTAADDVPPVMGSAIVDAALGLVAKRGPGRPPKAAQE